MDNKVVNKQISLKQIIDVANYLEDYKEEYDKKFTANEKNNEYENGKTKINYTIKFKNGKNITESDYNWFVGNITPAGAIKEIIIDLYVGYFKPNDNITSLDLYNKVDIILNFREDNVSISVDTKNQENEANNVYYNILDILENTEERYNNTIKNRNIRIQSFCISIGLVLSYILFFVLKAKINDIPPVVVNWMNNKSVLLIGQWIVAILLGNLFSYWYMLMLYKPLIPEARYAGYNSSTHRTVYRDDVEDYIQHSEVHFGMYWDAEKRRNKIEKIYKITKIVLLVQLIISVILFLILK